jgi:hypothetical protein
VILASQGENRPDDLLRGARKKNPWRGYLLWFGVGLLTEGATEEEKEEGIRKRGSSLERCKPLR